MPDTLSSEALEWARTHLRKFGDTDIFPVPFEYEAVDHAWNGLKPSLIATDLSRVSLRPDRRVFVPKPNGGFRAATQLDPLDQLLYAAVAYEAAELAEASRIPADQKVACAYRMKVTPDGGLFSPGSGWDDFHSRSRELAGDGRFTHVLSVDIADFYNRLGHHRVQNALELANVPLERTQSVERFLSQLTAKQSQGVPVGPTTSILLAEACLTDVDDFLRRQGLHHTRYVDDFRIFCTSRRAAVNLRRKLSEYLFSVHRLTFEGGKSTIYTTDRFVREELNDPKEQEEKAKLNTLNQMYEDLAEQLGRYFHEHLDEDDEKTIDLEAEKDSFIELFKLCVERRPLHLGLARHLLRKALRRRTNALNDLVFQNLETLSPVLRDVVNYLAQTISKKDPAVRGAQLIKFATQSDVADLPFIQLWVVELICRRPDLLQAAEAMAYGSKLDDSLGCRPVAALAIAYQQLDWVRSRKETWRNYGSWDRRAIINAAQILSVGERRPFLNMVVEQGDEMDRAVASWLLSK